MVRGGNEERLGVDSVAETFLNDLPSSTDGESRRKEERRQRIIETVRRTFLPTSQELEQFSESKVDLQ